MADQIKQPLHTQITINETNNNNNNNINNNNHNYQNKNIINSNSRTDMNNVMKPSFGPVIRTPNNQSRMMMNQQVPQAPTYQNSAQQQQQQQSQQNHNSPHNSIDIARTVTSLVDNLEADMARHSRRRPSFRYESRNFFVFFN